MTEMPGRRWLLPVVAVLLGVMSPPASAHHSQTQFDTTRTITLEGTVTEIRWTNPHAFVYIDGKDTSGTETSLQSWAIEAPGPRGLESAGWKKDSAKVGDKVTVNGNPRRDGKAQMLVTSITLPDGTKISVRPE